METVVTPETQTLTPGTPEHDALMVEKFQSQSTTTDKTTSETVERPAWLPEKFSSPEDLAASYAELEKKLSGGQEEKPATTTETPLEEARSVVDGAGLDFNALSDEFISTGALSEGSYKTLAEKGFDRDLVDSYIEGQTAKADLFRAEVLLEVGGEQSYTDMVTWAAQNLSKAEIEAYDAQVDSGNLTAAKMAVAGLKARFQRDNGEEPDLLNGDTGGASVETFRSTAELTAAMRDPRYKKDAAYRADVERKLAKSSLF
ncbi:capsid assembly protein [Agrobacterium sp. 16-172Ci]